MRRWWGTLLLGACLLLPLSGCIQQKKLEDLGMVNSAAIDGFNQQEDRANGSRKIIVAISIPSADASGKINVTNLQTEAESPKEARRKLSRKTKQLLVSGQLQNLIFGNELAANGIWTYLDSYRRDFQVGEKLRIIIAKGSAVELLTHKYPELPSVSEHTSELISQEAKLGEVPAGDLHTFVRDYFDDGTDPVLPLVTKKQETVEIDGIALMDGDIYKSKLDAEDAVPFFMLRSNLKNSELLIHFANSRTGKQEQAMLTSLVSKRKVTVKKAGRMPEAVIDVRIKGIILEYNGDSDLGNRSALDAVSRDMAGALRKKLQQIAEKVQAAGTDSMGMGVSVRNSMSYKAWKQLDWKGVYPKMPIQVQVRIELQDVGMIET